VEAGSAEMLCREVIGTEHRKWGRGRFAVSSLLMINNVYFFVRMSKGFFLSVKQR
jgi:hypothetical protein